MFGSFIRDEELPESDIDIIAEIKDQKTLLDFVRMERELSKSIGINVDLLTEEGISPL